MEEVEQMHEVKPEWSCVIKILDKISELIDAMDGGWPEMADMVSIITLEDREKRVSPEDIFFDLYAYLFRVYYRIKANPRRRDFNITSYNENTKTFWIQNYDYPTFKWAKKNGFNDGISNDIIEIHEDKLNFKQIAALKTKCK